MSDPSAAQPTAPKRPSYERIHDVLRARIESGALPEGLVLLEGPIAGLFGSSRSPVRQALVQLERDGLVRRFDGRSLMVGRAERPLRLELTPEHLALAPGDLAGGQPSQADALYYRVEREILTRSMFGRFRVNELALARHYDIGRAVARDLLLKGQQTGIVAKGERAHWWIVPLDEKRIRDLYQLRELLEPVALTAAAPHLPPALLQTFRERLRRALPRYGELDIVDLDGLEQDLHMTCLGFCPNREIVDALTRVRSSLIPGKHMQKILLGPRESDSFIAEHLLVMDALSEGDVERAERSLREHIAISREKGARRLHQFLERSRPPPVDYIME